MLYYFDWICLRRCRLKCTLHENDDDDDDIIFSLMALDIRMKRMKRR